MAVAAPRFATDLAVHADRPALLGADALTYAELEQRVAARVEQLVGPRRVHVLVARNTPAFIVEYLACLRLGHVVALTTQCRAGDARTTYADVTDLHPDVAVLLSTSGSTGNPKAVRLSHRNLEANADSIVQALGLSARDRVLTSLPGAYSYGLSVINSTLAVGGALVLTSDSITDQSFWETARAHAATVLPGVPYTFEMLDRLGWTPGLAIAFTGGFAPEYAPYLPEPMRAALVPAAAPPIEGAVALARAFAAEGAP